MSDGSDCGASTIFYVVVSFYVAGIVLRNFEVGVVKVSVGECFCRCGMSSGGTVGRCREKETIESVVVLVLSSVALMVSCGCDVRVTAKFVVVSAVTSVVVGCVGSGR